MSRQTLKYCKVETFLLASGSVLLKPFMQLSLQWQFPNEVGVDAGQVEISMELQSWSHKWDILCIRVVKLPDYTAICGNLHYFCCRSLACAHELIYQFWMFFQQLLSVLGAVHSLHRTRIHLHCLISIICMHSTNQFRLVANVVKYKF